MERREKRAAVYIRVSTESQRDEGYSIDAQKELLEAYCISRELKAREFYIDGGFSGSNIERPAMAKLISDIRRGEISHVIVYKLDRLSRSQKDTLYLIEDIFNPAGVVFISMNENMDTSTPIGRAMLGIMSAFAQLERETIRERTRMGMQERVKNGYWPGGGKIPFGYDYDKTKGILVPNADAETVQKAYELYLAGYSTDRIAEMLGLRYEHLALQILKRKTNAGYIVYNGVEYKGRHEPIISLETYEKTMAAMQERSRRPISGGGYLLTGLLVCGKCGAKMRYQKWGKTDCKIVCYSSDKSKRHLIRDPNCDNKRHSAWEIEDIVLKDLFALRVQGTKTSGEKAESVLEMLRGQENGAKAKLRRLYDLYGDSGDEMLLETISAQKKTLAALSRRLSEEEDIQKKADEIRKTRKEIEKIRESWPLFSVEEKKKVIRSCVEKIVITDDVVDVYYTFDV
ncbi:MAG: recombinase family protein [Ruminococcaceae bacterium]|nr:recombinase family protein [Oscillospiraceae bacterium]